MSDTPEQYIRRAIELFIADPPDSDFQEGYLSALLVFAHEGLGFAWNDELLMRASNFEPQTKQAAAFKRKFHVIDGDKK